MLDINDKKIEWFKKAKFGLFIHWGLYAVTEGYWNGEKDSGIVEWIAAHKRIPNSDYERLAEKMTCEKFNPDYIAALAADAGMKYCVFTAKHHDGFAMVFSITHRCVNFTKEGFCSRSRYLLRKSPQVICPVTI